MNKDDEITMYKEIAIFREKQAFRLENRLHKIVELIEALPLKEMNDTIKKIYDISMGKNEN